MTLHMNTPIWVWLYDFGRINHPEMWHGPIDKDDLCHPQAHTHAFTSEEDARKHPEEMGWPKDHKYILSRVWLN